MHQNQEFRFNEVLFEHRNKEYGAYALRNEADRMLTKAFFVGVSLLASISLAPVLINAFKADPIIKDTFDDGTRIIHEVQTFEKDPPVQVKPQVAPEKVKTIDDRLPEPKKIVTNEKKVATPEEKINAVSGVETSNGKEITTPTYVPASATIGTGPVINTVLPKVIPQPIDKQKVETELSAEASFNGGIESFRNKVMNTFDGSGFDSGDVMKTTITFIVEIDGTISGIKANGADADFNNEAIRTIKTISAKGKWTPGKNKQGESVRSAFKFPISMKFDN
ncbi:energy transducer TonB [Chryseobacterium arachidis]|nr:energy transducer TonB [Chryseobacterium arachidis]